MNSAFFKFGVFVACLFCFSELVQGQSVLLPVDLMAEHLTDPVGIDTVNPRLSWRLTGTRQTAYQILVSTNPPASGKVPGEVWDSGKTASAIHLEIYSGKPLKSFTKYYWQVIVWDKDARRSASKAASFETGMLRTKNGQETWISLGGVWK